MVCYNMAEQNITYFLYSNITFLNIVDGTTTQNNGTLGGNR
jgi:hypothetical protein